MQSFMDPCLPGRVHLGMMFMTKGKSPRMLWWDECGFWCFAACSKWCSESWSLLQALGLTQYIYIKITLYTVYTYYTVYAVYVYRKLFLLGVGQLICCRLNYFSIVFNEKQNPWESPCHVC